MKASQATVTPITSATETKAEPTTEKKPRQRSVVQQAATLATAIEKADLAIAEEKARHKSKLDELTAKRAALVDNVSDEVLKKATAILAG